MNTPCIEQSKAELVVIKGFEGETELFELRAE